MTENKEYIVGDILPVSARDYTFELRDTKEKITLENYYHRKYNLFLSYPQLPVVKTSKGSTVFPMELCKMKGGQRHPYKLNELQTSNMIKFAVQKPPQRLQSIKQGLAMLDWKGDEKLRKYTLSIDPDQIKTKSRVLKPPQVLFGGGKTANPVYSGRWDLRNQKFLLPNEAPLLAWGVGVLPGARNP